jgi:hypothetical protein
MDSTTPKSRSTFSSAPYSFKQEIAGYSTARERCRRWARADDDRRDLERSAKLFKAANFQPE